MKKQLILLSVLFSLVSIAPVQAKFDKSKLIVGGTLGGSFTNDVKSITVSPQVGYRFNQYFSSGLGVGYNYYSYDYGITGTSSQNYLGVNAYGQVNPIPYAAVRLQPEMQYLWGKDISSQAVPCVLVGAGLTLSAGNRGGVSAMIYYDVLQDKNSPYGNEIFYSVGYVFGF